MQDVKKARTSQRPSDKSLSLPALQDVTPEKVPPPIARGATYKLQHEGSRRNWLARHVSGKPTKSFGYQDTEESKLEAREKAIAWIAAQDDAK